MIPRWISVNNSAGLAEEYEGGVSKMSIFCPAVVSTSGFALNKAWMRWANFNTVGGLIENIPIFSFGLFKHIHGG